MADATSHSGTTRPAGHKVRTSVLDVSPFQLGTALTLLSFATVLFALAIFKLLSFFVMPSLFFDLLFVGFPLGAMIGARLTTGKSVSHRSLIVGLFVLQAIMLGSVFLGLLAKRFDYLRAHLFNVELPDLCGQLAVFVLLFLPYFAAYGMCEFLGYRLGRLHLGGRMDLVYALALFGAALAYPTLRFLLPLLGMAKVVGIALGVVSLAIFLISRGLPRRVALLELALVASELLWPGLEPRFLELYKGRGQQSTWQFQSELNCRPVFQAWGRYALCEILAAPGHDNYYGFYNDMFQWEYAPSRGFLNPGLGVLPLTQTPRDARIAIVGAGGGRQVRLAQLLNQERRIIALELEPAVYQAVRSREHLLHRFERVYEHPQVEAICCEARGYFESHDEPFDLIYMPSVGGYAQMMIEPGNMIRTFEAYRMMRERLSPRGVLAVWYPRGLDEHGVLTSQYVHTFRALKMPTRAYCNDLEWLILAHRDPSRPPPDPGELWRHLGARMSDDAAALVPRDYPVINDPRFTPVTDEKPFLAGNVRHILSTEQVRLLMLMACGLLACVGLITSLRIRRGWTESTPTFSATCGLSLLVGANFLLMEHALVMALFRSLYVYEDALALGAVAFLVLSGLGSLLASRGWRTPLGCVGLLCFGVFLIRASQLESGGVMPLFAVVSIATGTFFPALFDRCAKNPLAVFAMDAIGAGFGAICATFVPILWGFTVFFVLAGAIFLATLLFDAWFHHTFTPVNSG